MIEPRDGLRLWLIRHGQTAGNEEGWVQGRLDIPLNEIGQMQAQELGERMAQTSVQAVYSSPLQRAHATATILGHRSGLPVRILDELTEVDMGSWEQRRFQEINSGPDALGDRWVFGPDRSLLGARETLADLIQRGRRVVEIMQAQHSEGDICLVAHAGIILGVISSCLELSDGTFLPPLLIGNASVSLLEHRLNRWLLLFANDQHHLRSDWRAPDDMLIMLFGKPDAVNIRAGQR